MKAQKERVRLDAVAGKNPFSLSPSIVTESGWEGLNCKLNKFSYIFSILVSSNLVSRSFLMNSWMWIIYSDSWRRFEWFSIHPFLCCLLPSRIYFSQAFLPIQLAGHFLQILLRSRSCSICLSWRISSGTIFSGQRGSFIMKASRCHGNIIV